MTYSPIPKWTLTDTNGDPVVAGTLYFYEESTTTPKNVYSDAARTMSAGAELTTDSYGQVGPVYLDTEAPTKVVAKDAADVTLWSIDSLTPPSGATGVAGGGGVARATCPLDYGAVGDGAADETAEVQAALDAATGDVDLAGKTYRCDSALIWPEGIRIYNGTIDASLATALNVLSCQGSLGSGLALTANAAIGDNYVDISDTTGFAAGDWVLLASTASWAASSTDGELIRIKTVTSGTRLTFDSKVCDAYSTAQAASVKKLTTVKRCVLEDVRIITAYASTQYAIYASYSDGFEFRNVTVEGAYSAGIRIFRSANARFAGCTIRDIQNGAGILIQSAANGVRITDCEFGSAAAGVRVGNTENHVARHVVVRGCVFNGCSVAAVEFDENTQWCTADGNGIFGSSGGSESGIVSYGSDNRIVNNRISDVSVTGIVASIRRTKDVAIGADTYGPMSLECTRNKVRKAPTGIQLALTGAPLSAMAGIRIDHNEIDNATTGLDIDSSRILDRLSVSYNELDYIAGNAIDIAHTGVSSRMRVAHNMVRECKSGSGILVNADGNTSGLRLSDNDINEFGTYGIHVNVATAKTGSRIRIERNECITTQLSSEALLIEPTDAGSISDVSVIDNHLEANNPAQVLKFYDPYRLRVAGNTIRGTGATNGAIACLTNDATSASIGSIAIVDNPSIVGADFGVNIGALANNDMSNVVVDGNDISAETCVYVLAATGRKISNVRVSGNNCTSPAAAAVVVSSVDNDGIVNSVMYGNIVEAIARCIGLGRNKRLAAFGNIAHTTGATPATTAFNADTPVSAAISNNVIVNDESTDTNAIALEVAGSTCTDVLVSGNQCDGGYHSISESVSTPTKLMAVGNLSTGYNGSGNALDGTWSLGVASTTAGDFKTGY